MDNRAVFAVVGFIIGFMISFFYVNSQYQDQTTPNLKNKTAIEEKASPSKSQTGPLAAFGASKDAEKPTNDDAKAGGKYKNIQVVKEIPATELLTVMRSFNEALGVKCNYCHVSAEEAEKDDKPNKEIARQMLQMVREMNKTYPTKGNVTCFTCHRGATQPAS